MLVARERERRAVALDAPSAAAGRGSGPPGAKRSSRPARRTTACSVLAPGGDVDRGPLEQAHRDLVERHARSSSR